MDKTLSADSSRIRPGGDGQQGGEASGQIERIENRQVRQRFQQSFCVRFHSTTSPSEQTAPSGISTPRYHSAIARPASARHAPEELAER